MGEVPIDKRRPSPEQAQLAERIAHWQRIFDDVPANEAYDSADELRVAATDDLNTLWPESDELALHSGGYGLRGVFDDEQSLTLEEDFLEADIDFREGFEIVKRGPRHKQTWRVAHAFLTDIETGDGDSQPGILYLYAIGSLVTSLAEVEGSFYEALVDNQSPLHGVLTKIANDAAEVLGEPDFLELDLEGQRYYVNSFIEEAELQAERYGPVKRLPATVIAERAYTLERDHGQRQYQPLPLEDGVIIEGDCQGLTILAKHQLDAGFEIRAAEQLIDAEGLCVIIKPDRATSDDLGMARRKWIYLPISDGLEISFDFEAAAYDQTNDQSNTN